MRPLHVGLAGRLATSAGFTTAVGAVLILVVVVGLWESASRAGLLPRILVPAPTAVGASLGLLVRLPRFPIDVGTTTVETLSGFAIGGLLGIGCGVAMVYVSFLRQLLQPYVVAFQVVPKVTLAPFLVTFFGFGIAPKIVMAAAMAFFPILINTVSGLDSIGEDEQLLMRSLVASRWQTFSKLAWPASLPYIFAGLKTGLTLALTGAIVAEFVSAADGLGALVMKFSSDLNVSLMFAAILVNGLFGLALYGLLELWEFRLVFWKHLRSD